MRAAIGFILTTITLDILAMGVVVPVLPPLIQSFTHGNAAAAAHMVGIFATAWALMQFIFSPVQGALSDRFGRRPVILLSNLGLGLDYLLMAMAPSLGWLFAGRVISGITAASFSSASAYITDISPPERRAGRFGLISVAFGFGFVVGPVLGGLLGSVNPRLPFWLAGGLSLANFLFGALVLPESLPPENRAPWRWRRASPIGALHMLWTRPGLPGLSLIYFLGLVAQNVLPTLCVLYALNRYGVSLHQVSWMLGAMGISSALVGGVLTARVVRRIGEHCTLLAGLGCGVAAFAMMGWAPEWRLFMLAIPVLSLRGLADPALTALMTRCVGADEQGRLQGANSSLLGIAGLVAPSLYAESFAYFATAHHGFAIPGAPFLIAAMLLALALALAAGRARATPA